MVDIVVDIDTKIYACFKFSFNKKKHNIVNIISAKCPVAKRNTINKQTFSAMSTSKSMYHFEIREIPSLLRHYVGVFSY